MIRHLRSSVLVATGVLLAFGCGGSGGGSPPTGPPPGGGNHNPTVNLNIDKTVLNYNETAQLTATASDVDGDQVTFSWNAGRGTVQSSGPSATTATYTAPRSWGPDSATAVASDGQGGSARATATTYVRNPNTPGFTLGAVGSSNCGYGTPNPDGFILTITPSEDVLISNISIEPRNCSNCYRIINYSPPIPVSAGQVYTWQGGGCQTRSCCSFNGCGSCGYWSIGISGRRPAPDGGTFSYSCYSWSGPGSGCN